MIAKTGSGHQLYPSVIGKYGKGQTNNNGQQLIEMCSRNELYITNTFFDHKIAHRTTWTCPERVQDHKDKDGNIRRNPYRNQIDYIMTRTQYNTLVTDSRSYAGFETSTDHHFGKASFRLESYKMKPKKDIQERLKITQLQTHAVREAYQASVLKKMKTAEEHIEDTSTPQKVWHNIVEACQTFGKEQLGIKKRTRKSISKQVQELSTEQKNMRL